MDEAFSNLDDLSDKETLERLESLFETSLPPLDSPILNDHAANSILEGTSNSDHSQMLGQLDTGDDFFGQVTTASNFLQQVTAASSSSSIYTTTPSAVVSKSPGAVTQPPPVSLVTAPQQQQGRFILGPQPVMTMATGTILTSSTPTVIQGGLQFTATLQPAPPKATSTPAVKTSKQQPQLLPKPATSTNVVVTSVATGQRSMVTMATVAGGSNQPQQFLLNTGGVLTSAGSAPLLLTHQPFLYQPQGGNPILVMRPTAPTAPTILPIVSSTTPQRILLQHQPSGMITARPQIRINTPQGQQLIQQIQTPSGSELITVPLGGGQSGENAIMQQQPMASPTYVTTANAIDATETSPTKNSSAKKKAKKKLKAIKSDGGGNKSGLDLGELMKDVGLDDLDGYNGEGAQIITQDVEQPSVVSVQNAILTSQQPGENIIYTSGGNQIVAQIPQQIMQSAGGNQFQLVRGQSFILQSAPTAPTILTQATITGDGLAQSINLTGGSTPLFTASGNMIGTATVALPSTTVIEQGQQLGAVTTTCAALVSSQTSPKKSRNPPDPNRTPLYNDDRLPAGWHRKVSQRKSGASAGRFEVFIIGPTGKRFRSRNELKSFFEKTGETALTPEHFDFSTFGTNIANLPDQGSSKSGDSFSSSTPLVKQPDPGMPKLTPMVATTSSSVAPAFKSQLSQETAEADAQISQLLESLQKDSAIKLGNTPVDSDKMNELFSTFTGGDDSSCSSPPPAIIKPQSLANSTSQPKSPAVVAPSLPKVSSGTTGFQASFLNSISSPTAEEPTEKVGESALAIGGASTLRRALPNVPQNTKLVRGPNGSLQKVQTIELTPELQNRLRAVQARKLEFERQAVRSSKDEAELAQLNIQQQQILAAGRPVPTPNVSEQVSLSTATIVVSSLSSSSSISTVPPISKSIPVPNVTINNKTVPIRYTHSVGNQAISLQPPVVVTAEATAVLPQPAPSPASALDELTDDQKRTISLFKQKFAQVPPDQQEAYIAANKAALLQQLNFQPHQLRNLRNNQLQLQLLRSQGGAGIAPKRPLPMGAGTIRLPGDEGSSSSSTVGIARTKQEHAIAFSIKKFESQIKNDQDMAVNPKYKMPFKSVRNALMALLRFHVFYELDASPEEMVRAEDEFEDKSSMLLDKYHGMLDRYHFLLLQESKRMVSSSEEVMLARIWDTEERQIHAREKEEVEAGNMIDVPMLDEEKRKEYSQYLSVIHHRDVLQEKPGSSNEGSLPSFDDMPGPSAGHKRKRVESGDCRIGFKFSRSESGSWIKQHQNEGTGAEDEYESMHNELSRYEAVNKQMDSLVDDNDDSDEEFTLKDVDTERAIGSILDAESNDEDEDEDDDDVLNMGGDEDDVVAAAFGSSADSVQSAINSILDTLPQGDRIETPDLNNITGLLDSIEDETGVERDPVTEAAVNSIPQF